MRKLKNFEKIGLDKKSWMNTIFIVKKKKKIKEV
jgi:hypothetical protein